MDADEVSVDDVEPEHVGTAGGREQGPSSRRLYGDGRRGIPQPALGRTEEI